MNSRVVSGLSLGLLCCVVLANYQEARAVPAKCDKLCRLRQYHYNTGSIKYWKLQYPSCKYCQNSTAASVCLPVDGDKNTGATCTVPAGGENMNKRWLITSSTVCAYPLGTVFVESSTANPIDENDFANDDLTECPALMEVPAP